MRLYILLLLLIYIAVMQCTSDNPVAGPSTELENPVFVGIVLDSSLKPYSKANVVIYKFVHISNSENAFDTISIEINSLKADKNGTFKLSNISSGEYLINTFSRDSTLTALKRITLLNIPGSTIFDTLILSTPGSIKGVVTRGGQQVNSGNNQIGDGDIRLVLSGINQSFITDHDGSFSFKNIPEGTYSLSIYPDNNFFSEIRKSIQVKSGSVLFLDTIFLRRIPWVKPPKPNNLECKYDTISASVTLNWNAVHVENLLGYIVERRFKESILEPERIFTKDTTLIESLISYENGKEIFYSVRSITVQYEESYPEGPVSIIVKHR